MIADLSYIDRNLHDVRQEIAAAADRPPLLVAAVKYALPEELEHLLSCGVGAVGENRVQQLLSHEEIFRAHGAGVKIHFIGTLQTNKVRMVVDKVDCIESVDSLHLATEIERRAAALSRVMDVLIEINGAGESSKSGVDIANAAALAEKVDTMPHLALRGFMTMGPRFETQAEYRAYFADIRQLADRIWAELGKTGRPLLSMGMSESAAAAAAEGADLIRVGRRLFAGRPGGGEIIPAEIKPKHENKPKEYGGDEI